MVFLESDVEKVFKDSGSVNHVLRLSGKEVNRNFFRG